ncbi:hypothetical protein PMAYCL1PPCAC_11851, partial [Pristionchus mayeri]
WMKSSSPLRFLRVTRVWSTHRTSAYLHLSWLASVLHASNVTPDATNLFILSLNSLDNFLQFISCTFLPHAILLFFCASSDSFFSSFLAVPSPSSILFFLLAASVFPPLGFSRFLIAS